MNERLTPETLRAEAAFVHSFDEYEGDLIEKHADAWGTREKQWAEEREALMRAWYECPQDSVPEVLQDAFVELEHQIRTLEEWKR